MPILSPCRGIYSYRSPHVVSVPPVPSVSLSPGYMVLDSTCDFVAETFDIEFTPEYNSVLGGLGGDIFSFAALGIRVDGTNIYFYNINKSWLTQSLPCAMDSSKHRLQVVWKYYASSQWDIFAYLDGVSLGTVRLAFQSLETTGQWVWTLGTGMGVIGDKGFVGRVNYWALWHNEHFEKATGPATDLMALNLFTEGAGDRAYDSSGNNRSLVLGDNYAWV